MEGKKVRRERALRQCYQCYRLEEEVLKHAYERILPPVSRQSPREPLRGKRQVDGRPCTRMEA